MGEDTKQEDFIMPEFMSIPLFSSYSKSDAHRKESKFSNLPQILN
jgi:hypothetical protein